MKKKLKIDEPCHEDWSKMTTIEKGKHCTICTKSVIDFTQYSRTEIIDFLDTAEGQTCGRFKSGQIDFYGKEKTSFGVSKLPYYKTAAASALAVVGVGTSNVAAQDGEFYFKGEVAIEETAFNNIEMNLSGTVSSLSKKGLEGTKVGIYSGGRLIQSVLTDALGNYTLNIVKGSLLNNEYTLKVFVSGYETKTIEKLKCTKPEITVNVNMDKEIMMLGMIVAQVEPEKIEENVEVLKKHTPNPSQEGNEKYIKGKVGIINPKLPKKTIKICEENYEEKIIETNNTTDSIASSELNSFEVKVYPNPSRGQVFVRTNKRTIYEYVVMDLNGKIVFSGTKKGDSFELNFAGKPDGIYLISLYSNGLILKTKRVVISH